MHVHVGLGAPRVEDVQNLRRLHVEFAGVDDVTGAAAIAEAGLGTLEGDHVWLSIAALRAAGEHTETWRTGFAGMIDYARSQGWVRGEQVRAHVVRAGL
ncbi:hypothetical protein [Actinophytocola sediminis]